MRRAALVDLVLQFVDRLSRWPKQFIGDLARDGEERQVPERARERVRSAIGSNLSVRRAARFPNGLPVRRFLLDDEDGSCAVLADDLGLPPVEGVDGVVASLEAALRIVFLRFV